jgi:predicted CopG family antitoxin
MATKTISIETDVYSVLKKEKGRRESFSQVIRRVMAERPVDTLGELELALTGLEGIGAGRKRRRHQRAGVNAKLAGMRNTGPAKRPNLLRKSKGSLWEGPILRTLDGEEP